MLKLLLAVLPFVCSRNRRVRKPLQFSAPQSLPQTSFCAYQTFQRAALAYPRRRGPTGTGRQSRFRRDLPYREKEVSLNKQP